MQFRWPHCRNAIEIVEDTLLILGHFLFSVHQRFQLGCYPSANLAIDHAAYLDAAYGNETWCLGGRHYAELGSRVTS